MYALHDTRHLHFQHPQKFTLASTTFHASFTFTFRGSPLSLAFCMENSLLPKTLDTSSPFHTMSLDAMDRAEAFKRVSGLTWELASLVLDQVCNFNKYSARTK